MNRAFLFLMALIAACATTGDDGEGDLNLPTSGVGPFRKLSGAETRGIAPFVLDAADEARNAVQVQRRLTLERRVAHEERRQRRREPRVRRRQSRRAGTREGSRVGGESWT